VEELIFFEATFQLILLALALVSLRVRRGYSDLLLNGTNFDYFSPVPKIGSLLRPYQQRIS